MKPRAKTPADVWMATRALLGAHAALNYTRRRAHRHLDRQERLLWVLIALIALAPELIALGRMLIR